MFQDLLKLKQEIYRLHVKEKINPAAFTMFDQCIKVQLQAKLNMLDRQLQRIYKL